MKINPKDLQRDEVWAFIMNNWVKQYVRRKLDINQDSKVGQVDFWGANINPEFIKPASNEELTLPKELPWARTEQRQAIKSPVYNWYVPKPPMPKQGGSYMATMKDVRTYNPSNETNASWAGNVVSTPNMWKSEWPLDNIDWKATWINVLKNVYDPRNLLPWGTIRSFKNLLFK